jgi:hypothetical protein
LAAGFLAATVTLGNLVSRLPTCSVEISRGWLSRSGRRRQLPCRRRGVKALAHDTITPAVNTLQAVVELSRMASELAQLIASYMF